MSCCTLNDEGPMHPSLAVDVAGGFWATNDLNALADNDDGKKPSKRTHGGHNGLEDRKACLKRAKGFLVTP